MNTVATSVAVIAGCVVIAGGLVALVRAIFRFAVTVRDNTLATRNLTGKLEDLTSSIDGRFDSLAQRVTDLEHKTK